MLELDRFLHQLRRLIGKVEINRFSGSVPQLPEFLSLLQLMLTVRQQMYRRQYSILQLMNMDMIQTTQRTSFAANPEAAASFVFFVDRGVKPQQNAPLTQARYKEKSINLTVLILIVAGVGLIHLFGIQCFFWPGPLEPAPPKPVIMEVSTIRISPQKPIEEPKQKTSPPPSKTKPRQKVQRKPKIKKQILAQTGMAFSAEEQVLLKQLVENFDMQQFAIKKTDLSETTQAVPYSEAYLDAAYERNPKPEYPSIARSHGWQGKVTLRVQISEEGKVESVKIEKSSRHELLDEAATEAVKRWTFIPAMRGNKTVATSVLVPIIFSLQNHETADNNHMKTMDNKPLFSYG